MNATDNTPLITSDAVWSEFREALGRTPADFHRLEEAAGAARDALPVSVVDKASPPPSGDLHDYASQAPYWWPDPAMPDGLPYIRRDGEINPEFHGTDRDRLEAMCERVTALTLHAWATGDAGSVRAAGRTLRVWFLDAETRMNPNLRHAQRIPGRCEGRGIGIIDTICLCFLLDTVGRLPFGDGWTPADAAGLRAWFSDYLDWLLQSEQGREECGEHNNHGTWYDAQVACFAVFCGREETAREQIGRFTRARLAAQIADDGSQPHELSRTLSLSYCTFNLLGFAVLAQAGRRAGQDLCHWRSETGVGLCDAIRWMLPYYLNRRAWAWPQIAPFHQRNAALLLSIAAQEPGNDDWAETSRQLAAHPWERVVFWPERAKRQ